MQIETDKFRWVVNFTTGSDSDKIVTINVRNFPSVAPRPVPDKARLLRNQQLCGTRIGMYYVSLDEMRCGWGQIKYETTYLFHHRRPAAADPGSTVLQQQQARSGPYASVTQLQHIDNPSGLVSGCEGLYAI